MDGALLAGRIVLVALFVFSGAMKLVDLSGTAGHIAAQGVPVPMALAAAAGVLELICGLAICIGWKTRYAAIALILFTVAATVMFHHFWTFEGREQIDQMLHAFKNFSMIGGLLVLFAAGPGRYALDARASASLPRSGVRPIRTGI